MWRQQSPSRLQILSMTSKGFGSVRFICQFLVKQADLKHQCEILLDHQTQYVKLIDERRRAEDEMMERIYIKEISEINREYEVRCFLFKIIKGG